MLQVPEFLLFFFYRIILRHIVSSLRCKLDLQRSKRKFFLFFFFLDGSCIFLCLIVWMLLLQQQLSKEMKPEVQQHGALSVL